MATGRRFFAREIRIDIRDADNVLLRGVRVGWFEDGKDRGFVAAEDGHATLNPASKSSVLDLTVEYQGMKQSKKLAAGQSTWTFTYPVHQDAGGRAGAGGGGGSAVTGREQPQVAAAPVPPQRSTAVFVAIIGLIGTVLAAYWQFVYKPAQKDESVTVVAYVKDGASGRPIARAEVRLERTTGPETRLADDAGAARFKVKKGAEDATRLVARASGYEDWSQVLAPMAADHVVDVPLRGLGPVAGSSPAVKRAPGAPEGTWQVQLAGNIGLSRVRSGTLAFQPQPDRSSVVTGSLVIDDVPTRIVGRAGQQNQQLFLTFDAEAGATRWSGKGNLELRAVDRMRGHLTDAAGVELPLELRKP